MTLYIRNKIVSKKYNSSDDNCITLQKYNEVVSKFMNEIKVGKCKFNAILQFITDNLIKILKIYYT